MSQRLPAPVPGQALVDSILMKDARSQFGPAAELYLTSAVHSNPEALQRLLEIAEPKGGTLLDVATGAGHAALTFAPFVERAIATDITEGMLKVTARTAAERGFANLQVCFSDAEALPFQTDSLDAVVCRVAAHHFADVAKFVCESRRVLRSGGWFLLVDTVGSEEPEADERVHAFERLRDPSHVRNLRPASWRRLIETSGFYIEHEEINKKVLQAEDWLDRMRVPAPDRLTLRTMIENASGGFLDYLAPKVKHGQLWFHLDEITVFARAV